MKDVKGVSFVHLCTHAHIKVWYCNDVLKYFWWHSLAFCSARALFSSHSYPDAEGHHKALWRLTCGSTVFVHLCVW